MVSTEATTPASPALQMFPESVAAKIIDQYGLGFNTVMTVFGNILTIIILSQAKMRKSSIYVYMMALAVADMSFSLFGMPGRLWTQALINKDPASQNNVYCKVWLWLFNTTEGSSSWILACMSCERCLAILMPLKARGFISRRVTLWVLLVVHVVLAGILSMSIAFTGINKKGFCTYMPNFGGILIRVYIKPIAVVYIPSALIALCNLIIIAVLIKARTERNRELSVSKEKDSTYSTGVMLVVVSVTFFILKAPRQLYGSSNLPRTLAYLFPAREFAVYRLLLAISIWCGFFNHAVNILLYIATNNKFRVEFKRVFAKIFCLRRGKMDVHSGITKSSGVSKDTSSSSHSKVITKL